MRAVKALGDKFADMGEAEIAIACYQHLREIDRCDWLEVDVVLHELRTANPAAMQSAGRTPE